MQRVEPYLNTEQGYEKLLIQNQNVGDILQTYQKEEIPRYFKMNGRIFNTEEYPELANVLNTIGYQDSGARVYRAPFSSNNIWWASISTTEKYLITKPTTSSTYEIYAYKIFFTEEGLISNVIEIDTSFLLENSPSDIYVADENFFFVYNYTLYKINLDSSSVERINSLTKPSVEGYSDLSYYGVTMRKKNVIANFYVAYNNNNSKQRIYFLMIYYPEPKVITLKFQEDSVRNFYRLSGISAIYMDNSEIVISGYPLTKTNAGEYVRQGNYYGIIKIPFNITQKTIIAQDLKNISDNGLTNYSYPVSDSSIFWSNPIYEKINNTEFIMDSHLSKIMFFENGNVKLKKITILDDPSVKAYYSYSHCVLLLPNKILAFTQTARAANAPYYLFAEEQDFAFDDTAITFSNLSPIMIGQYMLEDFKTFSNYVFPFAVNAQSYGICFLLSNKYQTVPIQEKSYIKY